MADWLHGRFNVCLLVRSSAPWLLPFTLLEHHVHERTGDQTGRHRLANIDAVGGWRVHTADDTPRVIHCTFMRQGA